MAVIVCLSLPVEQISWSLIGKKGDILTGSLQVTINVLSFQRTQENVPSSDSQG